MHHAGFTVRDLDASLAWWKEMFGIEPALVVRAAEPVPGSVGAALGVPGAVLSFAFMAPDGLDKPFFELLEYRGAPQREEPPANNDVGAAHLAIEVDDAWAQYEHMRARGAEFRHAPIELAGGPLAGGVFAYVSTPDGVEVELIQLPPAAGRSR
jgi:catechol 2,3-dioxygenase-like lactoylglutathione lyase family enzyme